MTDTVDSTAPIGILGGTFSPVHIGHLRLAIEALEGLRLAEVRLLPLNQPNHRGAPSVSAELRLAMLRAAVAGGALKVDDREIQRGGTTYTIDTLVSLRAEYPKRPLCLLVGADALKGFCDWHRWEELLDYCHLIVVSRPSSEAELDVRLAHLINTVEVGDPDILRTEICGRIYFQPVPLLPISSSDIRSRIAAKRDISCLVPRSVQEFIERHQLYTLPE